MYDPSIVEAIGKVAKAVGTIIHGARSGRNGLIIMTGSGTSGRVAFMTARAFNNVFTTMGLPPLCRYLASGGDPALLLSDELPEVCALP